jgi:hypothetical protein
MVDLDAATTADLGRCWHQGPRVVQCSYTLTGVTVCEEGPYCDIPLVGEAPLSHWVVAIAQRRGGLFAHTLWVDRHSIWMATRAG